MPGLQLADPDISNWQGQIIYLDFDGEKGVTYSGPVTVGPFDVPAFRTLGTLAGQEQTIIADVFARLADIFVNSGVIFSSQRPNGAHPYSTIYVGGDDSAFAEYGGFLGLAERVDTGNGDCGDNGIVFADEVVRSYRDIDACSLALAGVIAHEAGHLLGFSHTGPSTDREGQLGDVSLPIDLSLGTPVTGSLDGTGDSDTYCIEMGAGQHLAVQLDGDSADESYDFNELYIRYGQPPTLTQYDAAGKELYGADQYAQIPNTQAGTYYILVRCGWDASPLGGYTLLARLPGIERVEVERGVDYEVPGAVTDDHYEYRVQVRGAGITGIAFTTPWEQDVDLQDLLPPGWDGVESADTDRGVLSFEIGIDDHGVPVFEFAWDQLTDAQWASLDTWSTVMAVAWDGGTWTAALNFASVSPSQPEPGPTSPVHRSVAADNVTIQWGPWNSPPPGSHIYVDLENAWGGGSLFAELPVAATSWTPAAPLGAGGLYECDVVFSTHAESSAGGVPVTVKSSAENDVVFVVGMPDTSLRGDPATGHAYFLTPPGAWWQTQYVAAGFGGNLATINDDAEETWLEGQYSPDEMFWIGLTDSRQEGTWEWISGEPVTYTHWAPWGEPSGGDGEDAAVLYGSWWHDAPVDWWERGIVELPAGVTPRLQDDHGNTSGDATVVAVPSSLEGQLSYWGDIDFFSFEAVAGRTYDLLLDLPESGLANGTLWLYGTDGRTLLAWDEEGGHGRGSRLVWTAPANGRYHFAVDANALLDVGAYTLHVAEIGLPADPPLAWFDHPAIWLDVQGDWGVATSAPYFVGATSDDDKMLHLLNVSDPSAPAEIGQYLPGDAEGRTILAGPRRFYLSDDGPRDTFGHAELVVLDLSVSGDPVEVSRIPIARSDADSMAVAGHYLYLGTQTEEIDDHACLEVYDISNPDAPLFVGLQELAGPPGSTFDPDQLLVAEGRAYVLHRPAGILSILDVQNPAAPALLGQCTLSTDPSAVAEYMAIAGDVLWVAVGWELHAIDVSDAAHPVQLSVLPLEARIHQIAIDGGWAYVGTAGLGVKVVDIFDPSDPVVIDSYTVAGALGTLALNGNYLYVPTGARRTAIFEVPPAPALPDLFVTHISMPVAVGNGAALPIEWIVQNRSTTPTTAVTWTDAVYLSADRMASPDELVATLERPGGLAARGIYNASLNVDTTGIAEGSYYIVVATDYGDVVAEQRERNNTTVSQGPVTIGITRLSPPVPTPGTFQRTGEAHYYIVSVGAGDYLQIVLDDANNIGHNELYVRYGQPPTRSEYDVRYATNLAADQTVEVPDTQAGDYYILVYPQSAPDALAAFTITAALLDFSILGLSPDYGGNTGHVTVQIRGAKFAEGTMASLISPYGMAIVSELMHFIDETEVWATFDLTQTPAGLYDIKLAQPSGVEVTLGDAFNVREGGMSELWVTLGLPSAFRPGRSNQFLVTFGNRGTIDAYDPVVWIDIPAGAQAWLEGGTVAADGHLMIEAWPAESQFRVFRPGEVRTVVGFIEPEAALSQVSLSASIFGGVTSAAGAEPYAPALTSPSEGTGNQHTEWDSPSGKEHFILDVWSTADILPSEDFFKGTILREFPGWWFDPHEPAAYGPPGFAVTVGPYMSGAEIRPHPWGAWLAGAGLRMDWKLFWVQVAEGVGDCQNDPPFVDPPGSDDGWPFLHDVREGFVGVFADYPGTDFQKLADRARHKSDGSRSASQKKHLEVHSVIWFESYPTRLQVERGIDWGYTLSVTLDPDDQDQRSGPVIRSVDPNDKVGPAGFGAQQYVKPEVGMPFTIYYENDPEAGANAPAQIVKIEDTLNAELDLATFELGDINLYGDYWVDVPDGVQYCETTVDLRPEGNNLLVHVVASLDSGSRTVMWQFTALDPETLATPDDPTAGFLPVNDKAIHNGEGHVSYMIRPVGSLATGTQITNQALITFDVNEPIATPTTLNTIDAGVPQSSVLPLPATSTLVDFQVSWSGQDDTGGSGIASYDIYVSTDSGSYTLWKDRTTETSATYPGQAGHTYSFYSVARDNVGHREQAPDTPDATIKALSPVYRFWKASDNTHFYTIKEGEKDKLIRDYSHIYAFEGPAYYAFTAGQQPAGALPVYRFWKASDNTHFYTIKEGEKQKLIDNFPHIYTYEGPAFYAYGTAEYPVGTRPVYRFWKWQGSTHFFTIKEGEKDKLIDLFPYVFTFENVVWYAYAV